MSATNCIRSEQFGNDDVSLGTWYKGEGIQCVDTFEAGGGRITLPHNHKHEEYN